MRSWTNWLVAIATLAVLIWGTFAITSAIKNAEKSEKETTQQATAPTKATSAQKAVGEEKKNEEKPSAFGVGFVFSILAAALILVIVASSRGGWRNALIQPIFVAICATFTLNCLAYLFTFPVWRWSFDHRVLFWGTNISFILFVFFITRPERPFRFVAYGIATLVIIGLSSSFFKDKGVEIPNRNGLAVSKIVYNGSVDNAPTELAFPVIGECESPGESGGKQLDKDGNPIQNKNSDESIDSGALQINNIVNADLIKNHPELDYIKSKKDNYEIGRLIRERDGGYKAWNATKACWEPKLVALGYGPAARKGAWPYTELVEAPVNEWGEPVVAEPGYNFITSWIGEGEPPHKIEYTTRDGRVFIREFPTVDGEKVTIPGSIKQFRAMSLKDKVTVKIVFTPIS